MKTTVELDEAKLERLMALTGIKTRREAIDFALAEAERIARINKMLSRARTEEEMKEAIDPKYNLLAAREREKPSYGHHR